MAQGEAGLALEVVPVIELFVSIIYYYIIIIIIIIIRIIAILPPAQPTHSLSLIPIPLV